MTSFEKILKQVQAEMDKGNDVPIGDDTDQAKALLEALGFAEENDNTVEDLASDDDTNESDDELQEIVKFLDYIESHFDEDGDTTQCGCCNSSDIDSQFDDAKNGSLLHAMANDAREAAEFLSSPEGIVSLSTVIVGTLLAVEGLTQALLANGTVKPYELEEAKNLVNDWVMEINNSFLR